MKYLKKIKRNYMMYKIAKRNFSQAILQSVGDSLLSTCQLAIGTDLFWYVHGVAFQYQLICLNVFNYELR